MRHRPGFEWLIAALAAVAIAVGVILILMNASPARGADLTLRPGELSLLAKVVAAESTGEPLAGARAVAWTVVNRMQDEPETFGSSITKVILRPYQYAKPAPIADNSPAYLRAMLATVQVLLGTVDDDSKGSTFFFRTDMKPWPRWARHMQVRATIGKHTFLRPVD